MALKEALPKYQLSILKSKIGDKYLDMEVPTKAENIIEGEWSLTKEEKDTAIELMFGVNSNAIMSKLKKFEPTQHFLNAFNASKETTHEINLLKPSILDLKVLNGNNFHLISVNETKSDKKINRNKKGLPILDETTKKPTYVAKAEGEIIFSQNKSNFNGFFDSYVATFNKGLFKKALINPFISKEFTEVLSYASNSNFDTELFSNFDLKLYISGKPEDILNMSLSKYFDSCQNLYTGGHNHCLAPNIFDKNCKIAYLKFDKPYKDTGGNVMPYTSFARCMIRNIKNELYFDIVYPKFSSDLKNFFHSMITKYTKMRSNFKDSTKTYYFTEVGLGRPYFDTVSGVAIKFNPNALKNPKLVGLGRYIKEAPEHILDSSTNVYNTVQGDFLVLSLKESTEESIKLIRSGMIYKQDIYKPYVDIVAFYKAKKKKDDILYGYKGSIEFDAIAEWLTDKPEKSEKSKKSIKRELLSDHYLDFTDDEDVKIIKKEKDRERKYISKHQMYREMIPFIDKKFYDDRLTENNIRLKRRKIAEDEIEIDLGNGYFAYKYKAKKQQN